MEKKDFSLAKKIKFTLILTLVFTLLITLIGEVVVRGFFNEIKEYSDKSVIDEQKGWAPKENYSSNYQMSTHGDEPIEYEVNYATEKHGFRTWGDINAKRSKVLFIGDSYVQAVEVSNDKTFFSHIGDSLDVEIFAMGQAGYGTLQEMMILEEYLEIINPDLIILQTCDNDFVDNYAPLEYNSKYKVGLRRPYFNLDGEIIYRRPVSQWKETVDKSKFIGLLRRKIENTFKDKSTKSSQDLMAEKKEGYEPYLISQNITSLLLKEIKRIAGETPIVAFSASPFEPQLTAIKKISNDAEIPFYDNIGTEIQRLSWHKKKVYSRDGYHWSERGHLKVSKLLIANLIESNLVEELNSN